MSQAPSGFDPNLFLDAQQTEVNEKRATLPAENPASDDGLYTALIGDVKTDSGTIGKGENVGKPWLSFLVPLKIEVPAQLQEALGLPPQLQLTDRVFADLTPDGKGIDNSKGKNRGQKMYRDALNLNNPGDVWSWRKATGGVVKVKVVHEMYEGNVTEKVGGVFRR